MPTRTCTLVAALLMSACAVAQESSPMTPPMPLPPGARWEATTLPGPAGVALRALLALPAEGAARAAPVVALHGCGGIGAPDGPIRPPARERDWAARLVAAGHPVVFPDSFGSRGAGEACGVANHPAPAFAIRSHDALAAADWARAQPWAGGRAPVLLGWSHGGSTVLAARALAAPGQIAAAIAFYPGCLGAPRGGAAPVPLLMLLGEADDWTPPVNCERWLPGESAVTRVTYIGANHGFDALGDVVRARALPSGRTVHAGGQPAAREAARGEVARFLASQP